MDALPFVRVVWLLVNQPACLPACQPAEPECVGTAGVPLLFFFEIMAS